jgi:hypothetical protein
VLAMLPSYKEPGRVTGLSYAELPELSRTLDRRSMPSPGARPISSRRRDTGPGRLDLCPFRDREAKILGAPAKHLARRALEMCDRHVHQ